MAKNQHFFFNLEKQRVSQNTIKKLDDEKEITNQTYFRTHNRILRKSFQKTAAKICGRNGKFFSDVDISELWKSSKTLWERFGQKDSYNSLKSMQNDKSPGSDRLTKEFWKKRTEGNLCRFCIWN